MPTVFELLDREWRRLSRDRVAAARLSDARCVAGRAASLADLERFVRTAGDEAVDRVLLALVERAVAGDAIAARVLLQLLLPGTRNLARRWWVLGDRDERAAAAVTAVYNRIRNYPLERRPGRVAANILMDAARELRRLAPQVVQVPCPDVAVRLQALAGHELPPPPHPAVELAALLRDAQDAGIVDADDAELILRSRVAGERVEDIAAQRGLRPRTLWHRRHRAEMALAAAHGQSPASMPAGAA